MAVDCRSIARTVLPAFVQGGSDFLVDSKMFIVDKKQKQLANGMLKTSRYANDQGEK